MGQEIETSAIVYELKPVLTNFATPYGASDGLGVPMKLDGVFDEGKGTGTIVSIFVLDKNQTKKGFDIRIWRSQPTTVADNAVFTYTDAMADEILYRASIVSTDYADVAAVSSDAQPTVKPGVLQSIAGSKDLWVTFNTTEAATYGAIDSLTIKLGILRDQ